MNREELQSVLNEYRIHATYIEHITDRVAKVHTEKGTYALKNAVIKELGDFSRFHSMLIETGFKYYIPIYPTAENHLYVQRGEEIYYLMPWVPRNMRDDQNHMHLELFQAVGNLHQRTKKEWTFEQANYEKLYEATIEKWEKDEQLFEQFVERSEKSWYMSPFELQVIMYFNETKQAYHFAKEKFQDWYEAIKENPIARGVLNHGHLSPSHLVKDDQNQYYLINFERSQFASPVHDLITFLHRKLTSFPVQCDECVQWLDKYEQIFPLSEAENKMFLSYLAYPTPIFQIVKQYEEREGKRSERDYCQRLIRRYWLMKNCEYVVMKWMQQKSPPPQSETPSTS